MQRWIVHPLSESSLGKVSGWAAPKWPCSPGCSGTLYKAQIWPAVHFGPVFTFDSSERAERQPPQHKMAVSDSEWKPEELNLFSENSLKTITFSKFNFLVIETRVWKTIPFLKQKIKQIRVNMFPHTCTNRPFSNHSTIWTARMSNVSETTFSHSKSCRSLDLRRRRLMV